MYYFYGKEGKRKGIDLIKNSLVIDSLKREKHNMSSKFSFQELLHQTFSELSVNSLTYNLKLKKK